MQRPRHRRNFVPSAPSRSSRALEALEQRLVLSGTYTISSVDLPLSATLPTPSGYSPVVTSPVDGGTYTLRQLVYYYDNSYNSTDDFVIDLSGLGSIPYTLAAAGTLENESMTGDLDVYLGGSFGSIGALVIQNGTIDANFIDRVFQVYQGATLQLNNVTIQNGFAQDDGGGDADSDAFGGGVLVGSSGTAGTLSLTGCTIVDNFATGIAGKAIESGSGNGRYGAGFNAAGGGLYGAAGSTISIDPASTIRDNAVRGGVGGSVSNPSVRLGGVGGSAFGGGVAINAPASGPQTSTALPAATLAIAGGAQILDNRINQTITSLGALVPGGGTGGACNSGTGGPGGNAYGAGLYMGSGQLNLSASANFVNFNGNTAVAGPGYYLSSTNPTGTAGTAAGAGAFLLPGQVAVTGTYAAGGILQFTDDTAVSVTGYTQNPFGVTYSSDSSGLTFATVAPNATDTGSTSANGAWTLRTAIAAANQLQSTGMAVKLVLDAGTFSVGSGSGAGSGSLSVVNTLDNGGELKIVGASSAETFISAAAVPGNVGQLQTPTFSFSGAKVILKDLTISGAASTGNGGAISMINSEVTITSAALSDNSATYGAGIYQSQGTLTIKNGQITANTASVSGGGLFASPDSKAILEDGTSFTSNAASGSGGAVYAVTAEVTFNSAKLESNTAASGGGIYQSKGTLKVLGSHLEDNTASGMGGGAFAASGSVFTMQGGKVSGNSSVGSNGGGIAATNAQLNFTSMSITGNTAVSAGGSGGGLYQAGGTVSLYETHVIANQADTGGGIAISGGTFHADHAVINKNTLVGGGSGGGLAIQGGASVDLQTVNVISNQALTTSGFGGGIYQSSGTLTAIGMKIQGNKANQGGGVYATLGTTTIGPGSISGNNATAGGGGVMSFDNHLTLSGPSIVSNSVTSGSSLAGYGGGLYQASGSTLTIVGNTRFKNNGSAAGGGLASSNSTLRATDTKFVGNRVTESGGGVFISNTGSAIVSWSNVSLASNTISSGSSNANGGGLILSGGTLNSNGLKVKNNTIQASGSGLIQGAGIYAGGAILNLDGVNNVSSNRLQTGSTANGGGLYLSDATLNSNGLKLQNNAIQSSGAGTIQGAGIFATGSTLNLNGGTNATTVINGNTLTGNGAGAAYGAGISITSGALKDNSLFNLTNNAILNVSIGAGGGVAFFENTSYASSYETTATGNNSSFGGADYAFTVQSTSDNNNNPSANGPSGISTFTGGSGSLRNAIAYSQNYMNGNSNNNSMAILLPNSSSNYILTLGSQIETSVAAGDSLAILGSNGNATIQGWYARTLYVNNASSGTLNLQNLTITGGDVVGSTYAAGGGVYQNSGIANLNAVTLTGNYVATTQQGSTGATGGQGDDGQTGGTGYSAYGGGYYLASGTLNVTSSVSITGNKVVGSQGGKGGQGGSGGAQPDGAYCNNTINAGNGGAGGTGGSALGGGVYVQPGATMNSPSGWSPSNNTATPGAGGPGGSGGAGAPGSDQCKWGGGSTGPTGATGSSEANYCYSSGNMFLTGNATIEPLARTGGGMAMPGGTLSLQNVQAASTSPNTAIGVQVSLYSADGTFITSTLTDQSGNYRFHSPFSGPGYIQITPVPTFDLVPLGTTGLDGRVSSIDPSTLRSAIVNFVAGVPAGRRLDVILKPVQTELITGGNWVKLVRTDTKAVLWKSQLKGKAYKGGFTVSTVDFNFDRTTDYVLIPRQGRATPIFLEGRFGTATHISRAVVGGLRKGFDVQALNFTGSSSPSEWLLSPSHNRSGRVSLIDLKANRTRWTSQDHVLGKTKIAITNSNNRDGFTPSVVFSSIQRRLHHFQKVVDAATGKLFRVDHNYVGKPDSPHDH